MRYAIVRAGKGAEEAFTPVGGGPWRRAHARIAMAGTFRFARPAVVATLALILAGAASGQQRSPKARPTIWDVQLGTPVDELPEEEFVDPACGTNGGPPGLRLDSFEQFERCRAEASGLREIWFRYDDELEYIARAARDPDAVARNNAMVVLGQPVILSLLVDRSGLVEGFRLFTDPHADEDLRANAYTVAFAFKARFGADGWDCNDLPPAAGETPIAGAFVKQVCRKVSDGQQIVVETRHYYKSGQALVDPNTGLATVNQFESSARLELVGVAALRR